MCVALQATPFKNWQDLENKKAYLAYLGNLVLVGCNPIIGLVVLFGGRKVEVYTFDDVTLVLLVREEVPLQPLAPPPAQSPFTSSSVTSIEPDEPAVSLLDTTRWSNFQWCLCLGLEWLLF